MSKRILIVEDELVVGLDLELILQRAGYHVCGVAASFEEAMELTVANKPDLVLIDVHLKGKLTGIHLARELQKAAIPFVYLSANTDQKVINAAFATHPYGFLVKPFQEKELLLALDVALFRHRDLLLFGQKKKRYLEQRLQNIALSGATKENKLTSITIELQTYISFDLLTMSSEKTSPDPLYGWGFLKNGYEQFKVINDADFLQIMEVDCDGLEKMFGIEPRRADITILNGAEFDRASKVMPVKDKIRTTFGIRSNIDLPLTLPDKKLLLAFYSREPDAYAEEQVKLLADISEVLERVLATIIFGLDKLVPYSGMDTTEFSGHGYATDMPGFESMIGSCPKITSVFDQIKQVAPFDTLVLITGETGTGKERVARAIHKLSSRADLPFIVIDCTGLADSLIELELFGYERETFDGKSDFQIGKFEAANGGTLFLDEIAAMPRTLQLKLLHLIQKKTIQRIGSKEVIPVDIRLIVSTNHQLQKEIAKGRFSLELYFRLNVFPIRLPLLHERKEDVLLLARYFAGMLSSQMDKEFTGLSEKMKAEILEYHWPGNIRELKNVIEQAMILSDGRRPLELRRQLGVA